VSFTHRDVMTPDHPRWAEFVKRLEGPEGCNFRKIWKWWRRRIVFRCDGNQSKPLTRRVLSAMGFDAPSIEASCRYFEANGGHCDCEVCFNVDVSHDAR
jgi:hypothetical protein